jgi:trigger factor
VVEVKPAITLGAYTGLAVEHTPKPFAETEVDEALTALQEQHAEYRSVERAADPGDLVIVDYTLTPEGQEPRSETGYGFVIGGGSVLPEMEEAVIGLTAGGSRQTRVHFADDHRNEALRGKSAEASVTVTEVKEKVLPALDDEFAKSVGGTFETLDALRAEIRTGLAARRDADNRRALETAVLDAVMAGHTFEVPEALILRQVGHQIEHAREHMRRQGVDPDKVPWDYKKLLEDLRPGAEKAVKRALLIEAIAEKEGLAAADADVDAEVERVAQASQRPAPAVHRMLEQSGDLEGIRHSLGERRTIDFLIEKNQAKTA